jgi:TolB-like protein
MRDLMKTDIDQSAVTIAVFPFENLTVNEDLHIFCKSFCTDLITELSSFRQFQIIAYQSVLQFPVPQKAASFPDFDYDYYIQGSFRNDQGHIRVNAQLYNNEKQHLIWARRFEGALDKLLDIQDLLLKEVVATLQEQLNLDLLTQIKRRQKTDLKAYECWLYGIDELKNGSLEHDLKARRYFQQAIDIDPEFSLAYSGMSLSYFNEWSCQLWDRWEISQNGALEWAEKAISLDEQNYVAAYVLGRVFLYEGDYESAEFYLRKSLSLNSNDPDSLIQIAACFLYLGFTEEALRIYERTLRINPLGKERIYPVGAIIFLELGEYEKARSLIVESRRSKWIDIEAFFAAIYFHLGDHENMRLHWQKYLDVYRRVINKGRDFQPNEPVEWMMKVNPFRQQTKMEPFWQYVSDGSLGQISEKPLTFTTDFPSSNEFIKEGSLWRLRYGDLSVALPEVKGFYDLQKLVANPEKQFHCSEFMDIKISSAGLEVIDDKARKAYQQRILELQEEIRWAEETSDTTRLSQTRKEYEDLVDHLSSALGFKGKVRQTGSTVEKARSAVTWRIRKAISKLEEAHPTLARHLTNTIKTGAFCSYEPEADINWITG